MSKKDNRTNRGRNPNRGEQYLNGQYVYYKSLRIDPYYPILAQNVDINLATHLETASNFETIAAQFESMGNAELTKEQQILKEKFG
jgi:hypothetical protein